MHLRRLIRGSINAVNKDKLIVWLASQGAIADNLTGVATPTYATAQPVWAQIQPVPSDMLAHLENLNIQGVLRSVYIRNAIATAVRANGTGGDLLQFPERWTTRAENAMRSWTVDSLVVTADSGAYSASGSVPWTPPQIRTWLVVEVPEQWDSWCHAIVRMQNDQNYVWTADSDVTADSSSTPGQRIQPTQAPPSPTWNADSNTTTADSPSTADG